MSRSIELVDRTLAETYASGVVGGDDGHEHPVYPHSVDLEQGRGIRELVVRERAVHVFEVGFALGVSALHIGAGLLEVGDPDATLWTLDPTETWLWHSAGRRLVETAGLTDVIRILEENSHMVLPRWLYEDKRVFDIAFIDGDHRFDPCFVDLFYASMLVKQGGLIVVDDMWMPSVRMAVAYFESNLELTMLADAVPGAFRWTRRPPWRKVRSGVGNTAVLRKPQVFVQRDGEHFVPFW